MLICHSANTSGCLRKPANTRLKTNPRKATSTLSTSVGFLPKSTVEPKSTNWILKRNASKFLNLSMAAKIHPFLDGGISKLLLMRNGKDKLQKKSHKRIVKNLVSLVQQLLLSSVVVGDRCSMLFLILSLPAKSQDFKIKLQLVSRGTVSVT